MIWALNTARLLSVCLIFSAAIAAPRVQAATLVVYGASGAIGGVIVQEALSRGDTVIGVSREPARFKVRDPRFRAVAGDVTNLASFEAVTRGVDAVIISVGGNGKENLPQNSVAAQAARVAVKAYTGVPNSPYVVQIGGATTMYETRDGVLSHAPFPAPAGSPGYGTLLGHLVALETYRASHIRWAVLTPPLDIEGWSQQGAPALHRTGKYRTSTTVLVRDASGKSALNIADLAVAAVDEAEHPRFVGERFTVGY